MTHKGWTWQNLHPNDGMDVVSSIWPAIGIWMHSQHQNSSLWMPKCTKFSQSPCRQCSWFKLRIFLKFNPKLFFISPCIKHGHHTFCPCFTILENHEHCEGQTIIQTRYPHKKQSTIIGLFEEVSCHNPNSATHCSYILVVPLHEGKKQQIEYLEKRWRVMMITRKLIMMKETMTVRSQIEDSHSMILWTKDEVSSCHLRKN